MPRMVSSTGRGHFTFRAGSGFSDSDWPSAANRPTLSGNTLTWIGPSGGGANNGAPVLQQRVLTPSGDVTSSSNNQVIEGLNVAGVLLVTHTGVTVRQCAFTQGGNANGFVCQFGTAASGVMEDCLIDGQKSMLACLMCRFTSPFDWNDWTVRRCNVMGAENLMSGNPNRVVLRDCYMHGTGNTLNPSYDADLIEYYGDQDCDCIHNTFDSRDCNSGTLNSGINLSNLGAIANVNMDNNLFIGGNWNAYTIDFNNTFGGGGMTWRFTNNGFYNQGGAGYQRNPAQQGTALANSGNFVAATLTSTSGALINGTGAI